MESNIDLKSLWSSQPVPEADQASIFKKIDQYKRIELRKSLVLNIALALTSIAVILIWIYFQPQLLTTKIGIVLTVLAMVLVMVFNRQIIPLFKKADDSQSNLEYLNTLLEIQTRSYYIQTRIMSLYFILLSAGIALYMYEYTLKIPPIWRAVAYTIVFLWMGFTWFILRPQIIKKTRSKMEELVTELENLKGQLSIDN